MDPVKEVDPELGAGVIGITMDQFSSTPLKTGYQRNGLWRTGGYDRVSLHLCWLRSLIYVFPNIRYATVSGMGLLDGKASEKAYIRPALHISLDALGATEFEYEPEPGDRGSGGDGTGGDGTGDGGTGGDGTGGTGGNGGGNGDNKGISTELLVGIGVVVLALVVTSILFLLFKKRKKGKRNGTS